MSRRRVFMVGLRSRKQAENPDWVETSNKKIKQV